MNNHSAVADSFFEVLTIAMVGLFTLVKVATFFAGNIV